MKRLRSFGDDLDSVGEKGVCKDWGRRDQDPDRPSSHRRFYSSSSSYDRSLDDDREVSRSSRKRIDHDSDGFDRSRKNFDRYRDSSDRGIHISSPRNASPRNIYGGDRSLHRSDSVSGYRRDYPKGIRSERDRSRREGSVSSRREESVLSWRRLSGNKDSDEDPRYSADSSRGYNRVVNEDRLKSKSKSPQGSRDIVKSPPWSKDSSCEQSKSVEVKKNDEAQGECGSSSSSSEMEEGELEPEPESEEKREPEQEEKSKHPVEDNSDKQDIEAKNQVDLEMKSEKESKSLADEEKRELNTEGDSDGKHESRMTLILTDSVNEAVGLPDGEKDSISGTAGSKEDEDEVVVVVEKEENVRADLEFLPSTDNEPGDPGSKEVEIEVEADQNLLPTEEKCTNVEVKAEEIDLIISNKEVTEENRMPDVTLTLINDKLTQNTKDKGKSLAVSLPSEGGNSVENGRWMERDLLACRDDGMEGPSSRGFELFFSPVVTKSEKTNNSGSNKYKDEKMKIEPLELCLGLPSVSLPLASHDPIPAPSSPSHARSIQSFPNSLRSNSDAFTTSISFSGSQTFVHNPSCSLTQNSCENNYEQSVGSHPIFQGVDQASQGTCPGQSSYDPNKRKEVPLYQRILLNGNGSLHASQSSQGILNSQPLQGQHARVSEGSSVLPARLDRQSSSLARQLSGLQPRHHDEVIRSSPTNSIGSHNTRSDYSKDNKKRLMRERSSGSLFRSNSQREFDQLVMGGTGFVEKIITMIVSEPIQVMASRVQEMTEHSIAYLKQNAYEMIMHEDKREQLNALQKALQNRSDITLEILMRSHRVQLEILVALKTGLQDFLQRSSNNIPTSDLAEIFLNIKCRNPACGSPIPVDECDCKICLQKNGFCSACMCLVCSKFDMASNTCSWVGCDICLHWCHTDCGLGESFIRNGRSVTGTHGTTTEMQFHCVACDHPSEMFGFVKEVFKTCAKEWKAETFSKELEYVKRIFAASNDVRGKKLYDVANHMLPRLENRSNLPEVYNFVMGFLTEGDSKFGNTGTFSVKESPRRNPGEGSNGSLGPIQEATWLSSVPIEKVSPRVDIASRAHTSLDWDQVVVGRHSGGDRHEMRISAAEKKQPVVVDELESIVRIKKAEAKMFQERADDARREAEGLKRITIAKNEKIEEEYMSRITKLRLVEAEERRKQKLEELEVIERAHQEYFSMKTRMEAEIKDLLSKMEATSKILSP